MVILGIESSCDDTGVAVVCDCCFHAIEKNNTAPSKDNLADMRILSNIVHSQISVHKAYGGVVPEYAARNHMATIDRCIQEALDKAKVSLSDVDAIAATSGPGLIGGLLVGTVTAKTLALATHKPFIAINHLEGHMLTVRLCYDVPFPFLLILASGGHFIFAEVNNIGSYKILGQTLDDAAGECLDKVAKLLGLPYPGGVEIEKLAMHGNPQRFTFPEPMLRHQGCDVSFSGLKTSARNIIQSDNLNSQDRCDLAASFQMAVMSFIVRQTKRAKKLCPNSTSIVLAGGVAANKLLRKMLDEFATECNLKFYAPPIPLCSDNAAMIAWSAIERLQAGLPTSTITTTTKPRWNL